MFNNFGKQQAAYLLGSDLSNQYIRYIGIGTGSAAVLTTDTTLATGSEKKRIEITGSPNFITARKVTLQADFNSIQMSGLTIMDFGLFHQASGTGFPGSLWLREGFGSVVFDGTNELQIISALEVL